MSEKVTKDIYRGIHFIRLSGLPEDQKDYFKQWLSDDNVIKILIDKQIFNDCVQYHQYENWYDNVFPVVHKREEEEASAGEEPLFNLSVQK